MLRALIASRLVTPPAIWGKLPGHADFVRSDMRHDESEGWRPWLAQLRVAGEGGQPEGAAIPTAFVLPPGALAFAPRRFVLGVITPSADRVGRHHPLLVYHLAHPRWVERHFAAHAQQPRDWLFWLARAVARHAGPQGTADMHMLQRTVWGLWRLHAPGLTDVWDRRRASALSTGPASAGDGARPKAGSPSSPDRVQSLLDELAGPAPADDPAAGLHGVRHLPWADWPQRLQRSRPDSAFWQQDAAGGFVNAANRLQQLWSGAS